MGLLSIFQRKKQTAAKPAKAGRSARAMPREAVPPAPGEAADAVREARTRARRRLLGATVLLLVGVIGFPLLFETQPRPIPVDLPIEIPSRTGAMMVDAPAASPRALSPASTALLNAAASAAALPPSAGQVDGHASGLGALGAALAGAAAHPAASPAPSSSLPPSPSASPSPRPAAPAAPARVADHAAPAPASPPARTDTHDHAKPAAVPRNDSGAVAAALLAGKPVPAASTAAAANGRFIVQIGAYADNAKAHEARIKVEKLGFKTYTQAVDTPAGRRVRVRVGPFASKAEADKVAGRIKSDGLPAAVRSL